MLQEPATLPMHAHGGLEGLRHPQLRGRKEIMARIEGHGTRSLEACEKARRQRLHGLLPALQQHVQMIGLRCAHPGGRIVAKGGPIHNDHLVKVRRHGASREEPGQASPQHQGSMPQTFCVHGLSFLFPRPRAAPLTNRGGARWSPPTAPAAPSGRSRRESPSDGASAESR